MGKWIFFLLFMISLRKLRFLEIGKECKKTFSHLGGEKLICANVTAYFFRKFDLALNRTHWLHCENCTLSNLDENTFNFSRNNISFVFLPNCKIRTIKKFAFVKFPLLKVLILYKNSIENIDTKAFNSVRKLLQLDLSRNNIKILINHLFIDLENLDMLNLKNNEIFYIQPEAFSGLMHLKYLYLSNNDLKQLEERTFRHLISLKILYLENNRIVEIHPLAFVNLRSLNFLYMNNNSISYLVQYNFKPLSSLVDLQLRSNNLKEIQTSSFNGLKNIKYLYLGDNKLNVIKPYGFIGLNSLQILDLGKNYFEVFHFSHLQHMENLKILWLAKNFINNFTIEPKADIHDFLQILDISDNNLTNINFDLLISKAPSLYEIFVANNSWGCQFLIRMFEHFQNFSVSMCSVPNNECSLNNTQNYIDAVCSDDTSAEDTSTDADFVKENASEPKITLCLIFVGIYLSSLIT